MSSQHGWTMDDATAEGIWEDANPYCIECDERGCLADRCPSSFCDLPHLVIHMGEPVHETCREAFDRHIENKCGDVCHCDAAPEAVEDFATEPTKAEAYEPIDADAARWWSRLAAVASLALALFSGACATTRPAVEVEAVGTLAAGPSTWSAPVHAATPPPSFEIAGPADDDAGEVATTTVRTAAAGESDAAPEVTAKGAGLTLGGTR